LLQLRQIHDAALDQLIRQPPQRVARQPLGKFAASFDTYVEIETRADVSSPAKGPALDQCWALSAPRPLDRHLRRRMHREVV